MSRANQFVTDVLISKLASALAGMDAIESPEELQKELSKVQCRSSRRISLR